MAQGRRNDGVLYTGMQSRRTVVQSEERQKDKDERSVRKAQLKPIHTDLLGLIDAERATLSEQVLEYVRADVPEEDIKSALLSVKMYETYLKDFKLKLFTIMRNHEKIPVVDDEKE